jgi:hypothetical protein
LFEELAEQLAKLSKAECLDAKSIAVVMTSITSHPSTALLEREKGMERAPPGLLPSPPISSDRVRDTFLSPSPENNEEEEGQSLAH